MITEEQINWAIRVMENPKMYHASVRETASRMADAYKQQEDRLLVFHMCMHRRDGGRELGNG